MNIQPIQDDGMEILGSKLGMEISNYFVRTGNMQVQDIATIVTNNGEVGQMKLVIMPPEQEAPGEQEDIVQEDEQIS